MNTGGGSGGGSIYMDGGSIYNCSIVDTLNHQTAATDTLVYASFGRNSTAGVVDLYCAPDLRTWLRAGYCDAIVLGVSGGSGASSATEVARFEATVATFAGTVATTGILVTGALGDGTYACGSGSITIANGVITSIT